MAVTIKECYLYLLDNESRTFIPTQNPIDDAIDGAYGFLEKSIEKCAKNPAGRHGKFNEDSEAKQMFLDYRNGAITFSDFACEIATKRYDWKERYEILTASDLFMCEVEIGEVEYVIGLELTCTEGMVHHVIQGSSGIQNNLIVHRSIIPNANLKNASFFMINLDTMDLTVLESMTSTEDDDTMLYADKILQCNTEISLKEAIKKARTAAKQIVEDKKLDQLSVIPAFERAVTDMVNGGLSLDMNQIAEEVFYEEPEVQKMYIEEVSKIGVGKSVSNQNRAKIPSKKSQKLKTNTGIEISIPLDYYNNKDYIELINNPDGSISIQIKNVNSVVNK